MPTALLYSSRTQQDIIFDAELTTLARTDSRFTLRMTLTREPASDWPGRIGRIDLPAIREALNDLDDVPDSFVCGPDGFVEATSSLLLRAGQPPDLIRTERFGPTGV